MTYFKFNELPVGSVKELHSPGFGMLRFVKSSSHLWMVEFAFRNAEPFMYTRFTTVIPEIEAASLYDEYEKKC